MRTPIGKTKRQAQAFLPEQLAAKILNELLEKFQQAPQNIDEVLLGNAVGLTATSPGFPCWKPAGPMPSPAHTLDYQCGSGLSAVQFAASRIAAGETRPRHRRRGRERKYGAAQAIQPEGSRFQGDGITYERAPFSTLRPSATPIWGKAPKTWLRLMDISREQMDAYALESHRKAQVAWKNSSLKDIVALALQDGTLLEKDQCILPGLSLDFLKRLPPPSSRTAGSLPATPA